MYITSPRYVPSAIDFIEKTSRDKIDDPIDVRVSVSFKEVVGTKYP